MGLISEFKAFSLKGNVLDLAIGVIIGAAFGKIVSSLVEDIITPAVLTPALKAANLVDLNQLVIPGTAIKYGNFLSQLISFLIVSIALFIVIKAVNRTYKRKIPVEVIIPNDEKLLIEIRDLLARQDKRSA
jgi:large conductance mechanosensitive channel